MKTDNFERELPSGYTLAYHINASDKKTGIIYTLLSFVPPIFTLIFACVLLIITGRGFSYGKTGIWGSVIILFVSSAVLLLYVVLHEVVHGITYKLFTGQKLTFGLKWNVAYCGIPGIYVHRKCALWACAMPFLVFNAVFLTATVCAYFYSSLVFLIASAILGVHIGGCVGDLHVISLFLFKFKDESALMKDDGPEQFFYIKEESN